MRSTRSLSWKERADPTGEVSIPTTWGDSAPQPRERTDGDSLVRGLFRRVGPKHSPRRWGVRKEGRVTDEGVLEAARAVRPHLVEFVGPNRATKLDTELAGLLADAAGGKDVESALRATLEADEATGLFLERVLGDAPRFRPSSVMSALTRSYSGLAGEPSPVSAEKFRCPHGDYVWYRMELGVSVEVCPTHHCHLEPV